MTHPSDADIDLAFLALEHCIDSISPPAGGPLIPFAVIEDAEGNRRVARFFAETLDDCLSQARQVVAAEADAVRAAIAFDGYLTLEGRRADAIYVELHARDAAHGYLFAQRYARGGFLRKTLNRIGAPALAADDLPTLLV